jgi:hypothetical protein
MFAAASLFSSSIGKRKLNNKDIGEEFYTNVDS